jgi:AbrB family looped-hinge helix DNA binding protein
MNLKFQTKLDQSGRVPLPSEILSELHLTPGTVLMIEEKDGRITLEPITEEPMIIEKDGLLVLHAQLTEDVSDIISQNRDKRLSSIIKDSLQ